MQCNLKDLLPFWRSIYLWISRALCYFYFSLCLNATHLDSLWKTSLKKKKWRLYCKQETALLTMLVLFYQKTFFFFISCPYFEFSCLEWSGFLEGCQKVKLTFWECVAGSCSLCTFSGGKLLCAKTGKGQFTTSFKLLDKPRNQRYSILQSHQPLNRVFLPRRCLYFTC